MQRRSVDQKEFKEIAVEILDDFDRVCRKYNLKYSIAYGTLLGAIRHKGYIPWDDDIDIIMPREDYERFISKTMDLRKNHCFISIDTDGEFNAPLAKIIDNRTALIQIGQFEKRELGVYIDIFVFDHIPDKESMKKKKFIYADFWLKCWKFSACKFHPNRFDNRFEKNLRYIASKMGIARYASLAMNRSAKKCVVGEKYGNLMFRAYSREKDILPRESFDNLIEISFEGRNVYAFSQYHEILKNWYGNYMELPPIEKQICRHTYEVYWK